MCGIAGIYHKEGLPSDREIIRKMSAAIAHRGPDEEGYHIDRTAHLTARRLSIIDLQAGAQPIYSPDKNLCIVFNGEIYNYRALRDELSSLGYVFQTRTDTEVVLAAYSMWGEACLNRLKVLPVFWMPTKRQEKSSPASLERWAIWRNMVPELGPSCQGRRSK